MHRQLCPAKSNCDLSLEDSRDTHQATNELNGLASISQLESKVKHLPTVLPLESSLVSNLSSTNTTYEIHGLVAFSETNMPKCVKRRYRNKPVLTRCPFGITKNFLEEVQLHYSAVCGYRNQLELESVKPAEIAASEASDDKFSETNFNKNDNPSLNSDIAQGREKNDDKLNHALKRRKEKQARDSNFFGMYRRVANIENKSSSVEDFYRLVDLSDIDAIQSSIANDKNVEIATDCNEQVRIDVTDGFATVFSERCRGWNANVLVHYARQVIQCALAPEILIGNEANIMDAIYLPHRSLGDRYCKILSLIISQLPKLFSVDLRDNRLTDIGIHSIIEAICRREQNDICMLDLSENKFDQVSAISLASYLCLPNCSIEKLYLEKADMDDEETSIFMKAMETNKSIRVLDCSRNAIGGMNEKLLLRSITGGRAIAQALHLNTTLCRLDLSWNKMGSRSGESLGRALEENRTLEYLNLSYNALGDKGIQAIVHALSLNTGLISLDLSYNGFSAYSMIVLSQSFEANDSLLNIQINGNKIGFEGGRALVRSLNYWNTDRHIGLNHCNLDGEDDCKGNGLFDPRSPAGVYSLILSNRYDWAVGYELLRCAALYPSYELKNCFLQTQQSHQNMLTKRKQIMLGYSEKAKFVYGERRRDVYRSTQRFKDDDDVANMDAAKWRRMLREIWLVDLATGKPFVLPRTGVFEVQCICTPLPPTRLSLINSSGLKYLKALMNRRNEDHARVLMASTIIRLATRDYQFCAYQAHHLLQCSDGDREDTVSLVLEFLPRIIDPAMLVSLLDLNLDTAGQKMLFRKAGYAFSAFTDCISGHYHLDLAHDLDREAVLRLAEWSVWESQSLRKMSGWNLASGGTSQNGHWSNFRNEKYCNVSLSRGITDSILQRILSHKIPGILEFDFVSTSRPPVSIQPIMPQRMTHFLKQCGLESVSLGDNRRELSEQQCSHSNANEQIYISSFYSNPAEVVFLSPLDDLKDGITYELLRSEEDLENISYLGCCGISTSSWHPSVVENLSKCLASSRCLFMKSCPIENKSIFVNAKGKRYSSTGNDFGMFGVVTTLVQTTLDSPHTDLVPIKEALTRSKVSVSVVLSSHVVVLRIFSMNANTILVHSPNQEMFNNVCDSFLTISVILKDGKPKTELNRTVSEYLREEFSSNISNSRNLEVRMHCQGKCIGNFSPFIGVTPGLSQRVVTYFYEAYVDGLPLEPFSTVSKTLYTWIPSEYVDILPTGLKGNPLFPSSLEIRHRLSSMWLSTAQAFQFIEKIMVSGGDTAEAVIAVHGRITDLENFHVVVNILSKELRMEVAKRLGWLNFLNPMYIDYTYDLDLRYSDNRSLTEVLVELAVWEPGPNFQQPKFSRKADSAQHEWIPGWNLPDRWNSKTAPSYVKDPGVPSDGHLVVTYCSDSSMGCGVNKKLRFQLCQKYFLIGVTNSDGLGMYASMQ